MDEVADPRLGSVLDGRYRLLQRIAQGSMGVVYRAERVKLGRMVAVKFLHGTYAADPQFVQRFEREVRVMSRIAHPHCVSIIDVGMAEGPYVVMEFVTGQTLRALIDRGPVAVPRAVHIARQMLAGLAHAHALGVVHRDIKPANVMLTEATGTGDHVRILDFGLATLVGSASGDLSQSQIVVGTPSYMAPEQSLGNKVDGRADVYATGVVLFELLTGDKPFRADSNYELIRLHREASPPRLRDAAPSTSFPPELELAVARAMAKRPEDRHASAIELSQALADAVAMAGDARADASVQLTERLLETLAVHPPSRPPPSPAAGATPSSPAGELGPGVGRDVARSSAAMAAATAPTIELAAVPHPDASAAAPTSVDAPAGGRSADGEPDEGPRPPSGAREADESSAAGFAPPARAATPVAPLQRDDRGRLAGRGDSSSGLDGERGGRRSGAARAWLALLVLVAGGGTMAWRAGLLRLSDEAPTEARGPRGNRGSVVAAAANARAGEQRGAGADERSLPGGPASDASAAPEADGGGAPAVGDAAPASATTDATAIDAARGTFDGGPVVAASPTAETDETAEPVAAVADTTAEADRAEPATVAELDRPERTPASADRADTLPEAIALVRAGRRDDAIAALRRVRQSARMSPYVPYLLGNLYFEKRWWSVGMEHYAEAIAKSRTYRSRATLNRNVIRALGDDKTQRAARALIERSIGRAALPHLDRAARSDRDPDIRKRAAAVARRLRR